ncbi:carbohydrate-binding domain-containing protein [Actinoplanes sp. NPDC049596]|uniref:carbohydrate-binding domain-containing protein n=1 Tax=unclassified Actinoplanes TaxID=2626549 RepID=UPI00341D2189
MRKLAVVPLFLLAACTTSSPAPAAPSPSPGDSAAAVLAADKAVHAPADQGGPVTVDLSGSASSAAVKIDNGTVAIGAAGTYRLTGSLTGQVVASAPKAAVTLILDNVTITSRTTAAIAAVEAVQLDVVLAPGSRNSLADAASYPQEADVDAALFSAGDLTVSGAGALTVTGNGNDGIASKNGLLITAAADDALHSNGAIHLAGATVTAASGDGGGPGGGPAGEEVGDYTATVSGGTLVIDAEGDGFDSNGTAAITGGTVVVSGPSGRGNGALDVNGTFTVAGGTVFVTGSASMPVAPAVDSTQAWLAVTLDTATPVGATLQVADGTGRALATFATRKPTENIVFSAPTLKKDTGYRILSGGLTTTGTLTSTTELATITTGVPPEGGWGRRPGR